MMASLPLQLPQLQRHSVPFAPAVIVGTAPPQARLSALEWSIVAMAESDGLSSVRETSRYVAAIAKFFGFKKPNRLANERLEALRRLAVLAWHHRWNVPKSEVAAFLKAGFSSDHYELIQTSIGQARTSHRRRTVR